MASKNQCRTEGLDQFSRWRSVGRISLFSYSGKPVLPLGIPPNAGIYHLLYNDGSHYFGEGFNLRRRLLEHCDSPKTKGNRTLQARIMLAGGASIKNALQMGVSEIFVDRESNLAEETYPGATQARRSKEKSLINRMRRQFPNVKVWAGRE